MRAILVLVIFLVSTAAYGDKLYKWVDENGLVHYGDEVPQAQERNATEVDTRRTTVTDAQQRDAEAAYSRDKAWLDKSRKPAARNAPVAPASGVSQTTQDSHSPTDKKGRCEEEWRKYRESLDCFGPYRTVFGGIRAEAFEHCTEMKQPEMCEN